MLAGPPRVGKTSLIMRVLEELKIVNVGGFYTEEIRERGLRVGFRIVSLDGKQGVLSHVDLVSGFRVGRYGVNISDLENIGVKSVLDSLGKDLIVVDEIGKMELFSERFKDAVLKALDTGRVFGTIKLSRDGFTEGIRKRQDTEIIEVSFQNRNQLVQELVGKIEG